MLNPLAGGGGFPGLLVVTVSTLGAEGCDLPWSDAARFLLLGGAWLWSQGLAILRRGRQQKKPHPYPVWLWRGACTLAAARWQALLA